MNSAYQDNTSLLLNSCDKYSSVWYPYFELIKLFWKQHPKNIYLNTETKQYATEGLDIQVMNCAEDVPWSERLYRCLEKIPTKYIFFSLEDFFLLDHVKDDLVQRAYEYMEEDPNIAVCRFLTSNDKRLIQSEKYEDFRIAENNIEYRLDTQFALWNKETLMGFLDRTESPWGFEAKGTERVKNTEKIFLYHFCEDNHDLSKMVFPYYITQTLGHGVAWGKWLWKNKPFFEKNGIKGVDYKSLGTLSERAVRLRLRYLYNQNATGLTALIKFFYLQLDRIGRSAQFFRIFGFRDGIRRIIKQRRNRKGV